MEDSKTKSKSKKSKSERRKQQKIAAALAESQQGDVAMANIDDSVPDSMAIDSVDLPVEPSPQAKRQKRQIDESPPDELNVLPSFPLPVQPEPPSKSVLYAQGLDKALLQAEVVDPNLVFALSDPNVSTKLGLSQKTLQRLGEQGITDLFAVQVVLLSFLLGTKPRLYSLFDPPRDVCASAPTGSGKTLAYVLPIVETLSTRVITRLRALIVLPTRDLVLQVQETFEAFCKGRGLKIAIATGHHSFSQEQSQLISKMDFPVAGGSSKIDILICTPGRLIDHLNSTPNFTLQHLRFLVIDEADRLLTQSFQDWLAQVLAATRPPSDNPIPPQPPRLEDDTTLKLPYPAGLAPDWMHLSGSARSRLHTDLDEPRESSCQKLLFSATLTKDPSKIASLNLRKPKYFIVKASEAGDEITGDDSFMMPTSLSEHMIICDPADKPLVLFHLMLNRSVTNALVFTKSAESTTRLMQLLEFFEQSRTEDCAGRDENPGPAKMAKAYSSDLSPSERKALLQRFREGKIDLLICSDLISRGMDISQVSHVVSYDAPIDIRKYVHRAGRTARAGRNGDAWSLVEEQEARHFKHMLSASNHLSKLEKVKVRESDLTPLRKYYQYSLEMLKAVYQH